MFLVRLVVQQALESLLQAPVIRLKQCIESLCVPLLAPVATEDAHHFQRRQVGSSLGRTMFLLVPYDH